jgi:hypothetical protein
MRGYIKGIGAMSAKEKGDKMGIAWEKKYAEFKSYDGMPEKGNRYILGNRLSSAMDLLV